MDWRDPRSEVSGQVVAVAEDHGDRVSGWGSWVGK